MSRLPEGPPAGPHKHDDGLREARDLTERVWNLERRVEKQSAIIEALFSLLTERGLSHAALAAEMKRIEQEKSAAVPKTCLRCGRAIGRRQTSCVYCGEERVIDSPFETL